MTAGLLQCPEHAFAANRARAAKRDRRSGTHPEGERPMRFGLFGGAQANSSRPGAGMGQGFHDYVELGIEADALGYHGTFLVEHHFTGWTQVSATLALLTWLAARTRRIRVGTAVMVLPWHNPVLLAEQAATLDLLCGGRLDLGVGKGYRHNEFKGFCIPPEEAQARFDEALDVMLKSWTATERFSHHGRFWRFEDIVVEPAPAQRPHPPIWMAAGSAESIREVAARGFNLLLDQFAAPEQIGERIAHFRAETKARGRAYDPMSVAVARDLYIARDAADKQAALERNAKLRRRTIDIARAPGRQGGSHVLAYADSASGNEASALYGSPEEIVRKLELLQSVGVHYVLCNLGGGSRETLRQLAAEVAPVFGHSMQAERRPA
jgi:alkanesulfonate monooxygenase SsuD/methylene tetrahydromethanopterin reductase-like flavin-dependent oxidoreductase (luciferase family)